MLGPFRCDVYRPLDHEKKEARFLKILPTGTGSESVPVVRSRLVVKSLDCDVEFDAISYCWGDPDDTRSITGDGYPFTVTRNAFEALETLETLGIKNYCLRYLWIDAVCINQNETSEKNHQVPLMRDISRRERAVHAWLAYKIPREHLLRATLRRTSAGEALDVINKDPEHVVMYQDILHCPWWDRLWVVQEALLASKVLFHLGRITIQWVSMKELFQHHVQGFMNEIRISEVPNGLFDFLEASKKVSEFFDLKVVSLTPREGAQATPNFLQCVKHKSVTDERDRVYGLIGLLPAQLSIEPDYNLSVAEVFKDFTLRFMKRLSNLDILQLCRSPSGTQSWPSWVSSTIVLSSCRA